MSGVNRVILVGNLGKDPELRQTNGGSGVCSFSIAVNETWKDKDGKKQERVEWIEVVAWKQLAEICSRYLTKGKQVYVEGKLRTRSWEDKDKNKRYKTEVIADNVQFLGGGGGKPKDDVFEQDPGPQVPDSDFPFVTCGGIW